VNNLAFAAVDVDDNSFHVCVIDPATKQSQYFQSKPTAKALIRKLNEQRPEGKDLKICYEATYLGYSLCRELRKARFDCEVIAPSLIPELPGKKVKTNRLDCKTLAEFYMKELLTSVHIPEKVDEADRDLIRSRKFLVETATSIKNHISSMCKRQGWNYREESQKKSYWTSHHMQWLEKKVNSVNESSAKISFKILLKQLRDTQDNIATYDSEIEHLANAQKYAAKVTALNCFRGIDTASALSLITELGDINRFSHPTKLASYAGLDIIEYSSGSKEKKFKITGNGNKFLRTTVIEACQFAMRPVLMSAAMKAQHLQATKQQSEIAKKCMERLHKKGTKLLYRGKHKNKIKAACAREMLCFIWESLKTAA